LLAVSACKPDRQDESANSITGDITMGETNTLSGSEDWNGNLLVNRQAILAEAATMQSMSPRLSTRRRWSARHAGVDLIKGPTREPP
jgi:hypothetical protein